MEQDSEMTASSLLAKEALGKIKKTWSELQEEPHKQYLPNGIPTSPSAANYCYKVQELEKQLNVLCDETSNRFGMELDYFTHTVDKECAYVKNYRPDSRKSKEENDSSLSTLMQEANNQIEIDLLPILQIDKQI